MILAPGSSHAQEPALAAESASPAEGMEAERGERSLLFPEERLREDRVWIAWETQRRSLNLSRRLNASLLLCLDEDRGWKRYPISISRTLAELRKRRGQIVAVQNPSMVLAALACLAKKIFGYALVVDRHSNFAYLAGAHPGLKRRLSDLLSDFTLRHADLTIVTNAELRARVEKVGGRGFVLPDPFPDPAPVWDGRLPEPRPEGAPKEILFVSSWAFDEPIAETIEACRRLQGKVIVRITGRMKPAYARLVRNAPPNFILTGFLSDREYFRAMAASDAVMAVTNREATLVCGGYEAVAMGKPLILGSSAALREYFDSGCVYTDGSAGDLEAQMRRLLAGLPGYQAGIRKLYETRRVEWEERLANLEAILGALKPAAAPPA